MGTDARSGPGLTEKRAGLDGARRQERDERKAKSLRLAFRLFLVIKDDADIV